MSLLEAFLRNKRVALISPWPHEIRFIIDFKEKLELLTPNNVF